MTPTPPQSRAVSGLRRPSRNLTGFPAGVVRGTRFRAHATGLGPWWFASAPTGPRQGGRFDLHEPDGTCYVASSIESAVRERLGPRAAGHQWLPGGPGSVLDQTTVSTLDPNDRPARGRIANTLSEKAAGWVSREISTSLDYSLTREWADAFHRAGFAGVRYQPRLSTGPATSEAWFAPRGAYDNLPSKPVPNWRDGLPIRSTIRVAAATIIT